MIRAVVVAENQAPEIREVDEEFLRATAHDQDVAVDVEWSSLNYKDGMALTGDKGVVRVSPLIPGIDVVGTLVDPAEGLAAGTRVVVNGAGCGETRHGGFAERVFVDPGALVALPDAIDPRRAAAIGTAGFTAMLSVLRLERDVPADAGDILVTGAAGGVGSVAVALLSRLGYRVVASTGRQEQADYLRSLGAAEVIDRGPLGAPGRPMQSPRWAGAVDSVGSHTLANVLAQTKWGGTVTACGLAQGSDLPATVLPFILRGVSLAGINSVEAPLRLRREAWSRLASDLDFDLLDSLTEEVPLDDVAGLAGAILAGNIRGRTVVGVRARQTGATYSKV
jgi:acrylyl-CoA reductase (NADPH)